MPPHDTPSPWLHRVAVLTAVGTFLLILVGGGVTSNDAGMAFPDWPTSDGVLVNPPGWWQQLDTRWEHGHRLIGWAVGMGAILVASLAWTSRSSRGVRIAAVGTLLAIGVQGIMGGMRVTQISITWAVIHGIWGQVCFSLVACVALATSAGWRACESRPTDSAELALVRRLSGVCTAALLVQLATGALTRHVNHGLMFHLFWAVVSAFLLGRLGIGVLGAIKEWKWARRVSAAMLVLVAIQLLLGMLAFLVTGGSSSKVVSPTLAQWAIPTAHVGVGSLVLASSVILTVGLHRFLEVSTPCPSQISKSPSSALP
ncbi:MAG: COX15/CtaA family protein [Planctomycetes bacterium]|nr:COX15/CtaA family protein [Planctomycetota bacterium]